MPDYDRRDMNPFAERQAGAPDVPATAEEAQAWIQTYSQIVQFREGVLAQMRDLQKDLPEVASAEIEAADIRPMEALIADYRERIRLLEQR